MKSECPYCNGNGWVTGEDNKTGDPIPAECEFCDGVGSFEVEAYDDENMRERFRDSI